tara:strand:+ start:309 stop:1007 length:699 start_codon:yes stop_codon:yes gene_type:complete
MTNIEILQVALRRVGLNTNSSTFKNSARDYLNLVGKDIQSREQWNWLFKSATFNTVADTRTYSLETDVLTPLSFRNITENHVIIVQSTQDIDAADPDSSTDGDPRFVAINGIDTNGAIQVTLYPTPDGVDSIGYRYYRQIPDFVELEDNNSINQYYPPVIQPALIYGISSLFKQEKGDDQGAGVDRNEMERVLAIASRQNLSVQGNRKFRMRRSDDTAVDNFSFYPTEGSLN